MSIANYDVYVSQMLFLFLIRGMFHDLIICVSRSIDNVITATAVERKELRSASNLNSSTNQIGC